MEIESGYPSETDAQNQVTTKNGRQIETFDPLNESKISYASILKVNKPP